jgi:acyl-CoA synthetase (AMP-forming)/AMP-acid ligase II
MPEGVLRKALQVFPNCQFIHAYGMTEAAPVLTVLPPRYTTLEGPYAGRIKSCGLAAHTAELKIVDENRREVPRGTIGEVDLGQRQPAGPQPMYPWMAPTQPTQLPGCTIICVRPAHHLPPARRRPLRPADQSAPAIAFKPGPLLWRL